MTRTPIPDCPQEDKPIRDRAWTEGQKLSRLRELAERWKRRASLSNGNGDLAFANNKCATELISILDAEGDGVPARSGGVGDADVERGLEMMFGVTGKDADVYRPGMRAALTNFASHSAEAVRDGEIEIRLFDSQWVNVVNHADCYAGMSKEDAVAKAIKLTEVEMARNFHEDKWPKKAAKEQSHD